MPGSKSPKKKKVQVVNGPVLDPSRWLKSETVHVPELGCEVQVRQLNYRDARKLADILGGKDRQMTVEEEAEALSLAIYYKGSRVFSQPDLLNDLSPDSRLKLTLSFQKLNYAGDAEKNSEEILSSDSATA